MESKTKPKKRTIIGRVISDKMDKTVIVEWETRKKHPIYKKYIKKYSKIKAHSDKNEASLGDLVQLIETRPISKEKSWRVVGILEKALTKGA